MISLFFVRKMQLQNSKQIKQKKNNTNTCKQSVLASMLRVNVAKSSFKRIKTKNTNRCELIFTNRTQSNQNKTTSIWTFTNEENNHAKTKKRDLLSQTKNNNLKKKKYFQRKKHLRKHSLPSILVGGY